MFDLKVARTITEHQGIVLIAELQTNFDISTFFITLFYFEVK